MVVESLVGGEIVSISPTPLHVTPTARSLFWFRKILGALFPAVDECFLQQKFLTGFLKIYSAENCAIYRFLLRFPLLLINLNNYAMLNLKKNFELLVLFQPSKFKFQSQNDFNWYIYCCRNLSAA